MDRAGQELEGSVGGSGYETSSDRDFEKILLASYPSQWALKTLQLKPGAGRRYETLSSGQRRQVSLLHSLHVQKNRTGLSRECQQLVDNSGI